ncbi:MAG: LysM peptidoglycan-binding domain-containing protein [Pseudomonadota bacterium]
MTIAELWQKLQDAYIRSGALSLPADNTLGSPAISALIGDAAYYPGGALVLTIEGTPQVGDTIVISGTFEQDFLGQTTPASTLIFRIDGDGVAQLDQSILLPAGWTLDATFTALKDTKAAGLSFSDAAFRLASVAHEAPEGLVLEQGLNLLGKVALKGPFAPVDWVWGAQGRSALWTGGRLRTGADPFGDVPQIALGPAIVETGLSVGATGLGAGIATSIAPDTDGKAEERFFLRGLLTVTPALNPFALSADLTEARQGLLTLQLGSIDSPLATLDDLAALANGTPLGNLVPSQVPLGDNLRLQSVSVSLSTISKKVVGAGVTVGLEGVDWTLLPNDVLTLQALRLTVTLSPTWKPSFVTSGAFGIGQDATIGMSVVIPKMTVTGALETGDTIPLAELVAQFFGGGVPDLGHPLVVNDLHFAMTPSDQTYRFRAGFETNDWVFGLGPDLPVPEITLEGFALAVARSQTVTSFDLTADLEFLNNPWTVSASLPDTKGGWTLSARLDAGTITVKDVIDGLLPKSWGVQFPDNANLPKITSLSVSFMTANRTFAVAGALDWEIEIIADELVFDIEATVRLQSARTDKTLPAQYSGEVGGTFSLNSLPLTVTYAFAPATKQITFEFQAITATYVSSVEDPYLRIAFGDKSLGEMLAFLLTLGRPGQQAKLSPPWNVLNAINLNGLLIEIHFKTRELRVLYRIAGGKDLGFLRLDAIGLTYKRLYGEPEVEIIIEGRLLGQEYTEKNPLAWNATDGAPPATPGAGASVLDLRYLGIGQHVSLRDVGSLQTVGDVINALREAAPAISDESANPLAQLGSLGFDPDSGWLIGADFTVIKTLTLSIVFNDPKVYGLLIELAGDKAGSFAGLKFEILYRKVTDTVGVYRIELKLPTVMRTFTTGNFSLTLPVVVVEIYTNGDFRIDMGFPPSLTDFSRSFNIQYFPFIGYGGFYFAKLSGATSTTVPKIDDGTFNPVIEFGIALSVGLGKTLSLGILSGGISVTVTGMVQGTYAFYEPYDSSRGSANFFLLQGTIGVLGQVYATVDFSVVKADVNLTVYAAVSLTVEVYQPALIEVVAGVRVKVKIKIVFVRVSFSFNATIREKFVIGKPSTPPWHVVGDGGRSARRRLSQRPLARHRPAHRTLPEVARAFPVTRLKALTLGTAAVGPPVEITLFVTPAVTKASIADLAVPDTPLSEAAAATDVPAISLQLFVETALPTEATGPGDARLVVGDAAEKGFSKLAGRIFGWALSDIGQAVDTVTAAELGDIEAALKDPANIEKYFSYAHIADFLSANARFTLAPRPVSGTPVSMAFFPMIPVLALKAGSYAFDFGSDRIVTPEYEKFVDRYFDDLAVDYANSVERNPDGTARTMAEPAPVEETVATLVFRKYFQLLTRAVVQAAIDELRTYKHSVTDAEGASLASIAAGFLPGQVAYVVRAGDTLGSIAADFDVSEVAIEDANPGVDFGDLKPGEMLAIPVTVTTARIVEANQAATGILYAWDETELASGPRAGAIRQRPVLGGIRYSIQAADTLDEIAKRFGIGAPDLAAGNADQGGLFAPGARISAGDLSVATRDGDTLASLARYYAVTEEALLDANTDPAIALAAGRELVVETADGAVRYTVKPGDTVGGIADAEGSSTAAILRLNADIRVAAGQQIVVQGAGLLLAEAVVVHYAVATGDTEDTILATYFGAATPELRQMLAAWNPEVDLATLAAGTILEFPYTPTFTNLARYFGIDAAALVAANAAVSGLLAQRAVLVVPPITPEIRATDSFASLADRYALGLAELGELLAATPGLFRDPNADEGPVVLTIANVPAFTISALTERLVSAGAFNEVAASVSRFLLHGLRLPHVEDDSAAAILSRPDRQAADSAAITTFPVFAMIGQEFEAPGTDTKDFAIDLSKTHLADWVALATGDTLSVPLSPEEMQQIAEFAAQTLDPQVRASRRLALIEYQARRTPLSLRLAWAAGALPADTCLSDPDRAAGEPTIWPLPTALIDAVAASRGQAAPYGLVKGHTRPDGRLSTTSLTCGFFATTVEIEIARVPVEGGDAPFLPDTYTIRGADDAGKHRLLETLLHLRETSGETAQIYPLYGADPVASDANSDGLVSDAFDRTASAVLKTNLSTLSHGTAPSPAFCRPAHVAERRPCRHREFHGGTKRRCPRTALGSQHGAVGRILSDVPPGRRRAAGSDLRGGQHRDADASGHPRLTGGGKRPVSLRLQHRGARGREHRSRAAGSVRPAVGSQDGGGGYADERGGGLSRARSHDRRAGGGERGDPRHPQPRRNPDPAGRRQPHGGAGRHPERHRGGGRDDRRGTGRC